MLLPMSQRATRIGNVAHVLGSALGTGVYDLSDAAYLLGLTESTVLRWSTPTPSKKPALVPPTHGWAFTFHDLLSLAVIAVLRQRNVTAPGIRRSLRYLQGEMGLPHPFAHRDVVEALRTVGSSLLFEDIDLTRGGQVALLETVESYLQPIQYGSNRLARLWKPALHIVLNPEVQAGKPCVQGNVSDDRRSGEPPFPR